MLCLALYVNQTLVMLHKVTELSAYLGQLKDLKINHCYKG